jgi:Raf kinase inhibitor-like YbhB/YbcL family protein
MRTIIALLSCAAGTAAADPPTKANPIEGSLTVTSTQFKDGGPMPADMTCDGTARMPQLSWSGAPDRTKSFAISVTDPDAPKGTFVHWVVSGIPANVTSLTAVPEGAVAGMNSNGDNGWQAPCPPPGTAHRYVFTVYALDTKLGDRDLTNARLDTAMNGHILAKGTITAHYERAGQATKVR